MDNKILGGKMRDPGNEVESCAVVRIWCPRIMLYSFITFLVKFY